MDYSMLVADDIDRSKVGIIDIVRVDKKTLGRLDMVAAAYYGSIDTLPILLQWNRIVDVSDMELNDVIEIPNMQDIINQMTDENKTLQVDFNDGDDMELPGVTDNANSDGSTRKTTFATKDGNTTIANPQLNIKTKKSVYNPETGEIIYY